MSFPRLFPDDEELGKKDDDFRPPNPTFTDSRHSPSPSTSLPLWISGPRFRRRRLVLLVGACVLLYLFFKNMPTTLTPSGMLVDSRDPTRTLKGFPVKQDPSLREAGQSLKQPASNVETPPPPGQLSGTRKTSVQKEMKGEKIPPILRGSEKTADHYYEGPIQFYALPASLHGISHTMGYRGENKNVLFVAANVKSASRLIPMACEMAQYNRNHVHFAFLGRDDIELDELKEINGVVNSACSVYWHDGRPDESMASTDARMEYSVTSALYHINQNMHPQVYLVDDEDSEERYLVKGLRAHAHREGRSVIDLPVDAIERMMWITRLDHASLAAWESVYIDILIHVPPESSGSLIRLLKSIEDADYFGARKPHLTIELPPHIEPATQRFLDNFVWPPLPKAGGKHQSLVTLRRRISTAHLSPFHASIRTAESFYSARPHQSHVLLLSTQAELSPLYYHYLFYSVLEYGYGYYASNTREGEALMGIALDLPSSLLDGATPFKPPTSTAEAGEMGGSEESPATTETNFFWQAPDTHAALYFGHKWAEFHNFVSKRLAPSHAVSPAAKVVSAAFPAFAEPMLELMRARCWFMLYPHLPGDASIATIHNELASVPEEYEPPAEAVPRSPEATAPPLKEGTPYLEPVEPPQLQPEHREGPLLRTQLTSLLPMDGDLPELTTLPLITHDGKDTTLSSAVNAAYEFADEFHTKVGGCTNKYSTMRVRGSVADLFCDAEPADNETPPPQSDTATGLTVGTDGKTYEPVRAGLEAAIDAQPAGSVPNAFALDPEIAPERLAPVTAADGKASAHEPVRAGLEAAINAQPEGSVPNAFALDPKIAPERLAADELADKAAQLKHSGLVFDSSQPPKQESAAGGGGGGGSSLRKNPNKDQGKKSNQIPHLPKPKFVNGVEVVSEEAKEAMQEEFKAHLRRVGGDPDKVMPKIAGD